MRKLGTAVPRQSAGRLPLLDEPSAGPEID
jgi:hypothetical protein